MSAVPVFKRILVYGAILAGAIAVVGSIVGFLVAGGTGVVSALIGTAIALVFLGITSASILIATRVAGGDMLNPGYFGIVMGAWLVKFIVFFVILVLLRGQPWVQPVVLFLSLIVAVIGTLAVDLVVIARSRLSYVSDVKMPGEENPAEKQTGGKD